jgi:hypothetical protein
MALFVDWPKVAVVPVKEPYSPTRISSPPPRRQAGTRRAAERTARSTRDFIVESLLVGDARKSVRILSQRREESQNLNSVRELS